MDAFTILMVLLFLLLLTIPLFSFRTALVVYAVGSLVLPYLHIGGMFIRFELIYAVWLFALLVVTKTIKSIPLRVHETVVLYSAYLLVVSASTMIALLGAPEQIFASVIVLYGLFRPLLVLLVFANAAIHSSFVPSIIRSFLGVSVGLNLFTIAQFLGVEVATRITERFYLSPTVSAPFEVLMATHGRLARPMSVFESPVFNANYTLTVMLVCLTLVQIERNPWLRRWLYLTGILAAVAGLMTLSTTFLAGTVALAAIVLCTNLRFPRRMVTLATATVIGGFVVFCAFRFSPVLQELVGGGLAYQVQRIATLQFFSSRYASESGILTETYSAIMERPIIGGGVVRRQEAFIGDSTYVAILHMGGLVGLAIYLFVFYRVLKLSSSRRGVAGSFGLLNSLVFQMTLLLLATGLGAPSLHIRRMSEWYWVLLGMSINRNLREASKQ